MTVRTPAQVVAHPLQRLGADEIRLAKALLTEHGLVGEHTRFAYLGLEEPPKAEVLAFRDGDPVDRRVRAILLDTASGGVASLTRGTVDSAVPIDTGRDAQPPIMLEDLVAVDEIVKADPGPAGAVGGRARRPGVRAAADQPPLAACSAIPVSGPCWSRPCSASPPARPSPGPSRPPSAWPPWPGSSTASGCARPGPTVYQGIGLGAGTRE